MSRAEFRTSFKAMGCPCELKLRAATLDAARHAGELIVADVRRLEVAYSRYRPDSLLSAINTVAKRGGRIEVDAETTLLLDYAATCHRESDGLFDITSGLLREAWHHDRNTLPDEACIADLLPRVGWQHLEWRAPSLNFPLPGMELDFGGIVKEYAVDRATSLCRDAGITAGIINLGGDVRVLGARPDETPWRIAIAHPRAAGTVLQTVGVRDGAMATSGDYERCIVVDGVRYGHVLSPRTGRPVRHLASVSVVADLCVVAGSAATIALLKETDGPAWLAELGLPHLWVDTAGKLGGTLVPALSGEAASC